MDLSLFDLANSESRREWEDGVDERLLPAAAAATPAPAAAPAPAPAPTPNILAFWDGAALAEDAAPAPAPAPPAPALAPPAKAASCACLASKARCLLRLRVRRNRSKPSSARAPTIDPTIGPAIHALSLLLFESLRVAEGDAEAEKCVLAGISAKKTPLTADSGHG